MAVAEATTSMRVASLVLSNDYRHPAVLAKEAATIDLLSEGRLEVGIGAGWKVIDYEQSGIVHDDASTWIDRMGEAITIIKGLWHDGPVDFEGEHYRITGMVGTPRPDQRPHPPLMVGGGGKKVLQLGAREADIVALNPKMVSDRSTTRPGRPRPPRRPTAGWGWIREGGRRPVQRSRALTSDCSWRSSRTIPIRCTRRWRAASASRRIRPGRTPYAMAGPPESMIDTLIERNVQALGLQLHRHPGRAGRGDGTRGGELRRPLTAMLQVGSDATRRTPTPA